MEAPWVINMRKELFAEVSVTLVKEQLSYILMRMPFSPHCLFENKIDED